MKLDDEANSGSQKVFFGFILTQFIEINQII